MAAASPHHRTSGLRQHTPALTVCSSEVQVGSPSFSALGYTSLKSDVGWLGSGRRQREGSTSGLVQVAGRILFLVVVGLTVNWGHLYLLQTPPQFLRVDPYISEPAAGLGIVLVPRRPSAASL